MNGFPKYLKMKPKSFTFNSLNECELIFEDALGDQLKVIGKDMMGIAADEEIYVTINRRKKESDE